MSALSMSLGSDGENKTNSLHLVAAQQKIKERHDRIDAIANVTSPINNISLM